MKRTKRTNRTNRITAVRKLGNTVLSTGTQVLSTGTQVLSSAREAAIMRAEEARDAAVVAANRLERAFEVRVTRAMSRLGVPTAKEVRALAREVATLKASVQRLSRSRARA